MGKIIVFANQKGGVGKTTSAVNIGAFMATSGKRILLVDFDPQGNLTSSVGADKSKLGIYDVLSGAATIENSIQETVQRNLFIVPSNINLTGASVELVDREGRNFFLKEILSKNTREWDYIFVDCPPSLGILTINGLAAAKHVIIPLQTEYFALEGLSLLLQTIKKVQGEINPDLSIAGIVFTMYDGRTRLAHEVVEEVTGYFRERVFKTVIPRNVRLSEAPSHGLPINCYDDACIGALSYKRLSEEVIARV